MPCTTRIEPGVTSSPVWTFRSSVVDLSRGFSSAECGRYKRTGMFRSETPCGFSSFLLTGLKRSRSCLLTPSHRLSESSLLRNMTVLPVPLRRKSAWGFLLVRNRWSGQRHRTSLTLLVKRSRRCFSSGSSFTRWSSGYLEKCTVSFQGSISCS